VPARVRAPLAAVRETKLVGMEAIRGGWRITGAERKRTGIERFRILETGDPSHFVFDFVDRRAGLPEGDYS